MGTIGYDELEDAMCFLGFDAPRQEVIDLIEDMIQTMPELNI